MKILAIRGRNIASLAGDFEIDFTTEPLRSAGIFAITGPTGSGKSTLLDTLCLALYDCTPRTLNAKENKVNVEDIKGKMLSQNDSRFLLRKGTVEGFAEVDFLAIDKKIYRARWSVRRSRDKVDGSLQNVVIRVDNLTDGTEEQGTKTQLQERLQVLIGLSFDQFSRTVLLAQGDFATFLKAKKNEKAGILEKLTGTEIYAQISASIFQKTMEVKQAYEEIARQITAIELLPEEKVTALLAERQAKEKEIEATLQANALLLTQLDWFEQDRILLAKEAEAQKRVLETTEALQAAQPTQHLLQAWELAQQILTPHRIFQEMTQLLTKEKDALRALQQEKAQQEVWLKKLKQQGETAKKEKELFDQKRTRLEPLLIKAHQLDILVTETDTQLKKAHEDLTKATQLYQQTTQALAKQQEALQIKQEKALNIADWFVHYEPYATLIPYKEKISLWITQYDQALQWMKSNETSYEATKRSYEAKVKRLETLQQEQEELNKALPTEVVVLRKQLQPNQPCPVCGATDHPFAKSLAVKNLQEEELERQKANVAKELERLTKDMEETQKVLVATQTNVKTFRKQAHQIRTDLTPWVSIIPQWETLLNEQTLKESVEKLCTQWEQNTQRKEQTEKAIEKDQLQLNNRKESLLRLKQELREKNDVFEKIQALRTQRTHDRARLFDGEPTAQIEKKLKQTQSQLEEALVQAITAKQKAEKAEQLNAGKTTQLTLQIKQHTADYETAQQAIEQWLAQQENWDNDKLTLILATPSATLEAKRNAWQSLIKQKETAETVLGERQRQTTLHRNLPSKPQQTEEACKEAAAAHKKTLITLQERTSDIRALLANHERGQKRIAHFEKELKKKSEIYKNWAKLNELYGSQNGAKFKDIAQGYTLDALLAYANQQLHELTGRYELQRVPDTLALQIKDLDMLGEIRSVHSLSGGESFLVSLALALGLSALSSNRMNVESLFIDEGFGSLDNETLRTSMDALEHLQTQGRKVGIISHVADITERIATQVRVIRIANGKSKVHVKEFL